METTALIDTVETIETSIPIETRTAIETSEAIEAVETIETSAVIETSVATEAGEVIEASVVVETSIVDTAPQPVVEETPMEVDMDIDSEPQSKQETISSPTHNLEPANTFIPETHPIDTMAPLETGQMDNAPLDPAQLDVDVPMIRPQTNPLESPSLAESESNAQPDIPLSIPCDVASIDTHSVSSMDTPLETMVPPSNTTIDGHVALEQEIVVETVSMLDPMDGVLHNDYDSLQNQHVDRNHQENIGHNMEQNSEQSVHMEQNSEQNQDNSNDHNEDKMRDNNEGEALSTGISLIEKGSEANVEIHPQNVVEIPVEKTTEPSSSEDVDMDIDPLDSVPYVNYPISSGQVSDHTNVNWSHPDSNVS
eukprot:TRINITY_DN9015_c0_g1_i1.p1 TRINITY_DN9015_c0_g1~~TRINITY_DN9015_c0_g1_i1.p1  ORF type:complete len:428 (-),score=77.46 TRINITY_DN9015_c0_g1_i1:25-1122(-)